MRKDVMDMSKITDTEKKVLFTLLDTDEKTPHTMRRLAGSYELISHKMVDGVQLFAVDSTYIEDLLATRLSGLFEDKASFLENYSNDDAEELLCDAMTVEEREPLAFRFVMRDNGDTDMLTCATDNMFATMAYTEFLSYLLCAKGQTDAANVLRELVHVPYIRMD